MPGLPDDLKPSIEPAPKKSFFSRFRPGASGGGRSLFGTIILFMLAPIIAISITTYAFQSYEVDGQSMETTLQNNDRLLVNKLPKTWARIKKSEYIPNRGDIIIFDQEGFASSTGEKQLIKRVIGLPGERVVVKNDKITVYNDQNPQGFNPDKANIYNVDAEVTAGMIDVVVPAGHVFVCGDNRNNSLDSRYFGPISAQHIIGKLSLRILPVNNAQKF